MSVVSPEHSYESLAYSAIKLVLFVTFNALEKEKKKSHECFFQMIFSERKAHYYTSDCRNHVLSHGRL